MDLRDIKPLGNRVIIERIREEKTAGGLFLVKPSGDTGTMKARVLAIGPGGFNSQGQRVPIEGFSVGDRVVLDTPGPVTLARMRPSTNPLDSGAEDIFSVPYDLILGVLEYESGE